MQEPSVMKFNEDQITQVLTALWIQANLSDNLPANIEAIAHSFFLTLITSRLKVRIQIIYHVLNILAVFHFPIRFVYQSLSLGIHHT